MYFVKNFAQASSLPYLSSTTCGEPVQTSAARFYQKEPLEIELSQVQMIKCYHIIRLRHLKSAIHLYTSKYNVKGLLPFASF